MADLKTRLTEPKKRKSYLELIYKETVYYSPEMDCIFVAWFDFSDSFMGYTNHGRKTKYFKVGYL